MVKPSARARCKKLDAYRGKETFTAPPHTGQPLVSGECLLFHFALTRDRRKSKMSIFSVPQFSQFIHISLLCIVVSGNGKSVSSSW
jgi:hypothetical protein